MEQLRKRVAELESERNRLTLRSGAVAHELVEAKADRDVAYICVEAAERRVEELEAALWGVFEWKEEISADLRLHTNPDPILDAVERALSGTAYTRAPSPETQPRANQPTNQPTRRNEMSTETKHTPGRLIVDDWSARLIVEAGTVRHETGLTPRQLSEQRAELLGALEAMNDAFRVDRTAFTEEQEQAVTLMDAALEKATGEKLEPLPKGDIAAV